MSIWMLFMRRWNIDYRSNVLAVPGRPDSGTVDINTGVGFVNCGSATANIAKKVQQKYTEYYLISQYFVE
jgi:hypothetical protein